MDLEIALFTAVTLFQDDLINLRTGKPGDFGDLIAQPVKQGDVEQDAKVVIVVIPDIRWSSLGCDEPVPLFPYPDGVRLNARKGLHVLNGKIIHISGGMDC